MKKVCTKCNVEKDCNESNFAFRNDQQRFRAACIECMRAKDRTRRPGTPKISCERCGNKLPKQSYRMKYCDTCRNSLAKERPKKWCQENKERAYHTQKLYRANNRDKINARQRELRKIPENLEKERVRKRKYSHIRLAKRAHEPVLSLRHRVSCNIRNFMKRHGLEKRRSSITKFLPYSLVELKQHLESQFEPWMNWSNWGKYDSNTWDDGDSSTWTWQIDHIVPHSELQYDSLAHPNFTKAWALENLRPLSSKQNIIDGTCKIRHKTYGDI